MTIAAENQTHPTLGTAAARFAALAQSCRLATEADDEGLVPGLREVLARIAAEPELRFFVDGTRNFGHQASTVGQMKRLIDRTGYTGRVRIVYADYGNPHLGRTAEKLAVLLPGLDPRSIDDARLRYGTCRDITFLPYGRRGELSQRAAFGLTGGADDMSVNYAHELNVRFFCRIQPYLWDDGPSRKADPYYESSRIECADGRCLYMVDSWPAFRHLVVKAPAEDGSAVPPSVWSWYTEEQGFDAQLRARVRNARALDNALSRRGGCRVWPAYGLHHFRETAAEVTLRCAIAACRLQVGAQAPLVQVWFTPEEEVPAARALITLLAADVDRRDRSLPLLGEGLRRRGRAALAERFRAELGPWLDTGRRLTFIPTRDPDAGAYAEAAAAIQSAVRDAMAGDVVIVSLGAQPAPIFHSFYARADLPGIIEGQATSSVLLSRGVPFLQILRAEQVFDNGYPPGVPGYDGAAVAERLNRLGIALRDGGDATDLSPLVRGGDAYECPIDDYFRRIAAHFGKDIHDKLFVGLLALGAVQDAAEP